MNGQRKEVIITLDVVGLILAILSIVIEILSTMVLNMEIVRLVLVFIFLIEDQMLRFVEDFHVLCLEPVVELPLILMETLVFGVTV